MVRLLPNSAGYGRGPNKDVNPDYIGDSVTARNQKDANVKNRILRGSQSSVVPSNLRSGKGFLGGQVIQSLKKGGMINKTGLYQLHKGEMVVPKNKLKKVWHLSDTGAMKS